MKLILLRHGRTKENARRTVQGQFKGGPLDEVGIVQVERVAHALQHEHIDVCYASDLERAMQTARAILRFHPGVPLVPSLEIREKAYGVFEGLPSDIYFSARDQAGVPFHDFKPDGGETHIEVRDRVSRFYRSLFSCHQDHTVLVVSHGAVLALLYLSFLNLSFEQYDNYRAANTAISMFEAATPDAIRAITVNSVDHLAGL